MPLMLLGDRDTMAFNLPASRGKDEFQQSGHESLRGSLREV